MELYKYTSPGLILRFYQIINKRWIHECIPEDWRIVVIMLIFKKSNSADCTNYRGISPLNAEFKVYAKILPQQVNSIAETMLLETQNGFGKGRSCMDGVFIIKQLA
jgi:hypothetical protein